jgi:predicted secreted Zn-dependent protease
MMEKEESVEAAATAAAVEAAAAAVRVEEEETGRKLRRSYLKMKQGVFQQRKNKKRDMFDYINISS